MYIQAGDINSGVTRVGCHPGRQLYFFLEKNLTIFLVIASERDDLFYLSSPSFHVVYPVFVLNSATKINFRSGVTPWRMSPGAVRPSSSP